MTPPPALIIISTTRQSKSKKCVIKVLGNVCNIVTSHLLVSYVKGDRFVISIPEDEYLLGIDSYKHNLYGIILWSKVSSPLIVLSLCCKLSWLRLSIAKWGIISLGKDFFEFSFLSLEDVYRVRETSSWNINLWVLKLFL